MRQGSRGGRCTTVHGEGEGMNSEAGKWGEEGALYMLMEKE